MNDDLQMTPLTGDQALFIEEDHQGVQGLLNICTDDFLHAGNAAFQALTQRTLETFEAKPRMWDSVDSAGVAIKTKSEPERILSLGQERYVEAAAMLPLDTSFETFVSARATLAWVAHSRPDLCCAINRVAQVTSTSFCKRHIQEFNKAFKYAKATKELGLSYSHLYKDSLHLRVYADASFASNDDLSSQLEYIALLCDDRDGCHV